MTLLSKSCIYYCGSIRKKRDLQAGSDVEVVVTVLMVLSCSLILPLRHILEAHTVTFTRGRLIVAFSGPIPITRNQRDFKLISGTDIHLQ